jgi:hypothetical protein
MKHGVIISLALLSLSLFGCSSGNLFGPTITPTATIIPTATQMPKVEDATWQIQINKVEDYLDPRGLACSDCGQMTGGDVLRPKSGYKVITITGNIINKTTTNKGESVIGIGITTDNGSDDCGYNVEDSNLCLLMGYKLEGKTHINVGMATIDFISSFNISPNEPNGESFDFYFLIKKDAKIVDFVFGKLPKISISSNT